MKNGSDIYLFNPTSEMAVANGTESWQPNQVLQQFEEDLAILPAYFAAKEDIVLVKSIPGNAFLEQFQKLSVQFPSFMDIQELEHGVLNEEILLNSIKPWGWSQVVPWKLKSIWTHCNETFLNGPNGKWNRGLKEFISREFALKILREIIHIAQPDKVLLSENDFPVKCESLHEIGDEHNKNNLSIVKLPWSSSGRGLQVINQKKIHPSVINRLKGAIKQQGFVMIEPMLDKKLDFALHFEVTAHEIKYLGRSIFATSDDGKYEANYLNESIPLKHQQYFLFMSEFEEKLAALLGEALRNLQLGSVYNGFLGIDCMVFLQEGKLKIHPCVEINLRYNMGLLALRLEKLIEPSSKGVFLQYGGKQGSFFEFLQEKEQELPLIFSDNRLKQGVFSLTEPRHSSFFGAYLHVTTN